MFAQHGREARCSTGGVALRRSGLATLAMDSMWLCFVVAGLSGWLTLKARDSTCAPAKAHGR